MQTTTAVAAASSASTISRPLSGSVRRTSTLARSSLRSLRTANGPNTVTSPLKASSTAAARSSSRSTDAAPNSVGETSSTAAMARTRTVRGRISRWLYSTFFQKIA
jgi:hypothetical protein